MRASFWLLLILSACAQREVKPTLVTAEKADATYRARAHTELAAGYYSRGQLGVVLDELAEALRADSSYVPAYNMMGLTYMELRDDRLASQNFAKALALKPSDSETNNNYGWYLCNRGHERESIKHFSVAIADPLYPTPEKPLVNAGICSRRFGDETAALDYFARALKIRSDEPQASYNLAAIYFQSGDYERAKNYLSTALRTAAATPEALWLGIQLERKLGDKGAEASYGLQLRRKFPNARETQLLTDGEQ